MPPSVTMINIRADADMGMSFNPVNTYGPL